MAENWKQTHDAESSSTTQYLDEYRLLDRASRMTRNEHQKSFTERKLRQVQGWIRQGRGQGRGESYSPWIRITRGFSSPVSHQVFGALSIHHRNHHFLSKLEYHTALQIAYLGAVELRECLPMWPTEHLHPLHEDSSHRTVGLLEIAHEAGIQHGNFVGCDVPYVASLDMLATVIWKGREHHIGVSCKPEEVLQGSARAKERAMLDELYCREIGARHLREGGAGFNPTLIKNLDAYRPAKREITQWAATPQLQEFSELVNITEEGIPLHQMITQAGAAVNVDAEAAGCLWRVGLWLHTIDIDASKRISMFKPIQRGAHQCLGQLAAHFLGVMS